MGKYQYKFPATCSITEQAQVALSEAQGCYTYLLHFDSPVPKGGGQSSAGHYIGMTNDMARRLNQHVLGRKTSGSGLVSMAMKRGTVIVVRIWPQDGHFEQYIKARRNNKRLCPICKDDKAEATKAYKRRIKNERGFA